MAEDLHITETADKETRYRELLPQLQALVDGEPDLVANLGNIAAALRQTFGWWWVGFYLVQNDQLVLGPFQGPVACTRIAMGKGVCGTSWQRKTTLVVPDVDQFPGHIACSGASRSEIVVPMLRGSDVLGVLDVDSEFLNHFDDTDRTWLEQVADLAARCCKG